MVRCWLFFIVLSISYAGFCEKPAGFLWYSIPKEDKKQEKRPFGVPFSQLSYSARDRVLAFYTREAWHKAMNHLTVRDMRNYLALQDYWMKRATNTSRIFEKTMLYYPEFHYEVTHPSNSIGVKVSDEIREKKEQIAIQALSKQHGLLYFYRGANAYDKKASPIISDFAKHYQFKLIPVSVDGVIDSLFPNSKTGKTQADKLGIRFYPALILVHPKTKRTQPVSYGILSQDMLARQFLLVATDFARGDL